MNDTLESARKGYLQAFGCYFFWGILPLYFKLIDEIGPIEIVAHRIVWSLLFVFVVLAARKEVGLLLRHLRNWRLLLVLGGSSILIAANWLIYVWAVVEGHILAASLGYFLNPLVSVLLGVVLLKERLVRAQKWAILFAAIGVSLLAFSALDTLWISLTLAISFAFYGYIRKTAPVEALPGLAIETIILLPFAIAWLAWQTAQGDLGFGRQWDSSALLLMTGAITSVPLLLFAGAARLLPLATLGVMQYLAPTLQFFIGVFLYREPMVPEKLGSFALIWIGLAIFAHDALRRHARQPVAQA